MRVGQLRFSPGNINRRNRLRSVVEGERRILIGAADIEGVDPRVRGDGGDVEKMMR